MIHLFDKYYMKSDQNQIIVGKMNTRINKNSEEEECLANVRYYATPEQAIMGTYKVLKRETIQDINGDLKDAVQALQSMTDAFRQSVEESIPDINIRITNNITQAPSAQTRSS